MYNAQNRLYQDVGGILGLYYEFARLLGFYEVCFARILLGLAC